MGDHFDISGVFEATEFEIAKSACISMLMDQVETLHVCGYWSEILCCTITTHLSDLEVKVMGHRF